MALLELDQHELETILIALSIEKQAVVNTGKRLGYSNPETPTLDGIAKKCQSALSEIQKDIEFERETSLETLQKITG